MTKTEAKPAIAEATAHTPSGLIASSEGTGVLTIIERQIAAVPGRLMDHWRRVVPADRFTEVEYERLVADREAETRRLIAFLGLD